MKDFWSKAFDRAIHIGSFLFAIWLCEPTNLWLFGLFFVIVSTGLDALNAIIKRKLDELRNNNRPEEIHVVEVVTVELDDEFEPKKDVL